MDIKVYDYVIDPVTIEQTFEFLSRTFYSFGSTSDDMVASDVSWVRNHKGDNIVKPLYEALSNVCDVPSYESITTTYTDLLRAGDLPRTVRSISKSVNIFCVNPEWNCYWGGEIVFYDDEEIYKAIVPKPGRVISFDGRIPYATRPPLRPSHQPRYNTVIEF
tara:strand:- start:3729 stop:4214 length:486 start_codon:yes stop_codon:yes gene_type:complete